MPDNLSLKRPQDASKISLTEPWEVKYWTQELGVSETKLKELVAKYGHSAATIRSHLK